MENAEKQQHIIDNRIRKKRGLRLSTKLVMIFIAVIIITIALLTVITWHQTLSLGYKLRDISVSDATSALNDNARESLERMTTDTAASKADFLYQRDQDILLLAQLMPSDESYRIFSENRNGNLYNEPVALYDEITFADLNGQELFKHVSSNTTKSDYPLSPDKMDISDNINTYMQAENYWDNLQNLEPGEIYVSDVTGAYVNTNVNMENPDGRHFEGIIRWVTPVTDFNGEIWGYVTLALNYDHIMKFEAIGAGIDEFARPVELMEERIIAAINDDLKENAIQLLIISAVMFVLILVVAILVANSYTKRINQLITGLSRFQSGERHFRMNSSAKDEFGELADSFDDMADSVESSLTKTGDGDVNEDNQLAEYVQTIISDSHPEDHTIQ